MITVDAALAELFALVRPLGAECVPLRHAAGRVLAEAAIARRTQPPFAASAMDGYAISTTDCVPGDRFKVIGESSAGKGFSGKVGQGEAVRVFTGAPVPASGQRIIIQEDADRSGDVITLGGRLDPALYIRPAGLDFTCGDPFEPARPLRPADVALLAAMGHADVLVRRRPEIALIATGDELVMPGETPGPDQIIASNSFGLAAQIEAAGGLARLLPIARDTPSSLNTAFDLAAGADLIVTIGGASVGDHDLVAQVAQSRGLDPAFHRIAMRPGKPLMAGRLGGTPMIGLPGNPVSSLVCGIVFLLPMMRVMQGLPAAPAPRRTGRLAAPVAANGKREHYMRAHLTEDGLAPLDNQDSARLGALASADALVIRPVDDPARVAGEQVSYIAL